MKSFIQYFTESNDEEISLDTAVKAIPSSNVTKSNTVRYKGNIFKTTHTFRGSNRVQYWLVYKANNGIGACIHRLDGPAEITYRDDVKKHIDNFYISGRYIPQDRTYWKDPRVVAYNLNLTDKQQKQAVDLAGI